MNKRKFKNSKILKLFRSKPRTETKDIYEQLVETIKERKKILVKWERLFTPGTKVVKDIHDQLHDTIAELKRSRDQFGERSIQKKDGGFSFNGKRAA